MKYEMIFGDSKLFDGAPENAEFCVKNKVMGFVFYKCNAKRELVFSGGPIIAMRRIIAEPKRWTTEDQKAGRLPEVGAEFQTSIGKRKCVITEGKFIFTVNDNSVEVFDIDSAMPLETPEEKAERLRSEWAESNGFQYGIGVWKKTNPAPLCNCKYLNDVEYWIYIKGSKSKILGSYASKSMVYTSKINKADKAEFSHPTCKPVELMEKFIINHTDAGCVVIDPFMGSGSTGVACKNLNRKFIGIEMDDKYFEIAKNRIMSA